LKKYSILFIFGIISVLLLAGCSSATADEIVDYNNEFLITDYSDETNTFLELWGEYEEIYAEESYEETATYFENELIPQAEKMLDLVKNKKIEAEELQEVHNLLIQSEEKQLESFEKEVMFLQDGATDEALDEEIFELDEESYDLYEQFVEEFEELVDKYDIEEEEE